MILLRDLKLNPGYTKEQLEVKVKKKLYNYAIKSISIQKESLDSRKHDDIHYVVNVLVESDFEDEIIKKANKVHNKNVMLTNVKKYEFPHIINTELREFIDIAQEFRPVIVGSGPAGYHAAVKLALAGFKPIVLERGKVVEERTKDVESFWSNTDDNVSVNSESNVCFGEGGAGTFSDGKLNTGNKDKGGYFKEVLETFVKYGASPEILYKSKPHIGTDVLRSILVNMRKDIEKYGGEVRFGHKVKNIVHETVINTFGYESELPIYELIIEGPDEEYTIKTHSVILAIGHSSRDTYEMLNNVGFSMEPKAFAVGVRVEHPVEVINKAMYGEDYRLKYGDSLPTADYKLTYHTTNDRAVFSFCMCPGGYVVNSSSEDGGTVINGMSYSGRDGRNSNSAIVVGVDPEDFGSDDLFAGMKFQKKLEQAAFREGSGKIPVESLGELNGNDEPSETVVPDMKGSYVKGNLRNVFPDYIIDSIIEAMPAFGKRIKGFDDPSTIMSAVESRTSSPLRIIRGNDMMTDNFPGIIPAGEGAGYAGGITSAAADGIKSAEALSDYLIEDLIECYKNFETSKYM
ncbi:MAG: FAD-dependent oxidoreductase [Eubacterium sp.]|nr:FAD-dependent oxidoreductase [Eubacterium sp.]